MASSSLLLRNKGWVKIRQEKFLKRTVFLRIEFASDSKEVAAFTSLKTYPLIRIIKSRKFIYKDEGGIFTF